MKHVLLGLMMCLCVGIGQVALAQHHAVDDTVFLTDSTEDPNEMRKRVDAGTLKAKALAQAKRNLGIASGA
jgi:hypothetical protein